VADDHGLDVAETESLLAAAGDAVRTARAGRPRPPRDEKVLAGWNGLMVSAFAEAGIVLDGEYADRATAALTFLREHLWDEHAGRLDRRYKDGDVGIPGYLEDYAFLGRGALDTYQATGDVDHLAFALDLARAVEAEFWDAEEETLYFTPASGEDLIARPQELDDSSTPSSAGVAAELLASLQHFTPRDDFGEIAEAVVRTHGDRLAADPLQHASLTLAADEIRHGSLELTIAAAEPPADWLDTIGDRYLPARLLAPRPPTEAGIEEWLDRLDMEEAPPIWADRSVRDGEPTVYACRSFACSPPLGDLEEALDWADSNLAAE
ncbi:MAG: thioredoxin domain-containing protein, partial [Haloarculaceae archaeon]